MTIQDIISNDRFKAVHSSVFGKLASEIIPKNMDEVWDLIKTKCAYNHQHINNSYLVVYDDRLIDIFYIDLNNLKSNIRDINLNKILDQG